MKALAPLTIVNGRLVLSQGEPVTLRREREAQPDTTLTVGWTNG